MYDHNDDDNDNDNTYLGFFGGVLLRGSFTSFSFQSLWKIQNLRIHSDVFISHIPGYSKWRKGILILSLVAPKILQKRRKFVKTVMKNLEDKLKVIWYQNVRNST